MVPANSPFRTLADMIRAFKERPEAISWGGGSAGGSDQILAGLVADAVGVPPGRINYVAFSGGGESLSAILGGQVSLGINGLAELEPQIEAGTVRALAISSAERLPGLDVPTLREQGVDRRIRELALGRRSARDQRERASASGVTHRGHGRSHRNGERRWRGIDGSIAICPVESSLQFVDGEETRVRTTSAVRHWTGQRRHAGVGRRVSTFVLTGLAICAIAALVVEAWCKRVATAPRPRTKMGTVWRPSDSALESSEPRCWPNCRVRHRVSGYVLADGTSIRRATSHS